MRISVFSGASGEQSGIDSLIDDMAAAAEAGFPSYWIPQLPMGPDALSVLTLAGSRVPDMELGTAVIPTYPRHPLVLSQQAATVTSVIGDRLALGIGLSHKPVIEQQYGMSFEKPIRHLREYLDALLPALDQEQVNVAGETISASSPPQMPGAPRPPVLVAALGPQMLKLTGRRADGTITWMTGTATLTEHTVPTITEAADEAGRSKPRVLAGFPVCCTDDVDAAREHASKAFRIYGLLPSYRAMLDREGLSGPEDMCIIGDEAHVAERVGAIADTGIDDMICAEFATNDDDRARTRACLQGLL